MGTFGTLAALQATTVELGDAADTTLTRVSAGVVAVEGVNVVLLSGAQTLTDKTLTSPVIGTSPTAAGATWTNLGTVTTADINGGTVDGVTIATSRVNPRTTTEASSATPTINTDNTDIHTITALAAAITSMSTNLSGTPVNGQKLSIRILDNATARAITWGASFASRGATLPTTTTLSKVTYVGFIWNSTASTWDCVAAITEA